MKELDEVTGEPRQESVFDRVERLAIEDHQPPAEPAGLLERVERLEFAVSILKRLIQGKQA